MIELLNTKLFTPRPRTNLVSRPYLVERLNAGLDRKLTLVAAPAGFGKTTLLSEWIPRSPRCVTWFSLDESDNDATRFWATFIASLQGLDPGLGAGALTLLQAPQAPPVTSTLTTLINDIAAFPDPFAIVLDDYHVIDSAAIHEALTYLIAHLPTNMHVVIATRTDPPLPLARLRARGKLTEIRAKHLRFTADEAKSFLALETGVHLTAEEVAVLDARTEGWIAGLKIAALSMQGREDISGFIRAFSGSHRHVLGYLAEEVLNQQPKGTMDFLLQTSILDRMRGSLCDAVTGESGGQTILENLENANLFITPLDEEGVWYRYHHLFAEVLRARLHQAFGDQVPEFYRRASKWFEQSGQVAEAIGYAISGADYSRASYLIASAIPSYTYIGAVRTLVNWINRLPEEHVFNNGELLSYEGWLHYLTGQVDQARKHAGKAQAYVTRNTTSVARGRLAFLNSQFAAADGNIAAAINYASEALDLIGEEDLYFRSLTLTTLAVAQPLLGNTKDTIDRLGEAARIGEKLRQPLATLVAYTKQADQLNLHGRLQEGRAICEHAIGLYRDLSGQPSPISAIAFAAGAKLAYEENDLDTFRQYLHEAIVRDKVLGLTGLNFEIMYLQALLEWSHGEIEAALTVVGEGRRTAEQIGLIGYVSIFATLEVDLLLKTGNLTTPNDWIEAAHPSIADGNNLLRINENIVFARYLIMQNRLAEVSILLEKIEKAAIRTGYFRHLLTILILKTLLHQRRGDPSQVHENLKQAIQLALSQNYRRVFLDEGDPMRMLLFDYQTMIKKQISNGIDEKSLRLLTYIDSLLAAFSHPASVEKSRPATMLEPLSERELDILRLIATGRTNKEIADILVIALSTVKSHINNLYGKLGTNRRTQAIATARDLGLLSE